MNGKYFSTGNYFYTRRRRHCDQPTHAGTSVVASYDSLWEMRDISRDVFRDRSTAMKGRVRNDAYETLHPRARLLS